jgi:hypothetical protein
MFEKLSEIFKEPRGEMWFRVGLVIESAPAELAEPAFARLAATFPGIVFDLLSKRSRQNMPFQRTFRVKRPLGGLRLVWSARQHYELVVFFVAGKPELWLCRALALLAMRPKRFFAFNEFGEGFWVNKEDWDAIRGHIERRLDWEVRRLKLLRRRNRCLARLRRWGRFFWWWIRLPFRIAAALMAALLFLPAVLVLTVLRTSYDTYWCRFRFFGKVASAPRREPGQETAEAAAAAGALPGGHLPAAPAAAGPRRQFTPVAPELRAERLLITGVCDGLAWTPGKIQSSDESFVSFWVEGLPPAADAADVRARVDSLELEVEFLAPPRSGPRQVNARLPAGIQPGQHQLAVSLGDTQSPPVPLTIESFEPLRIDPSG